MLTRAACRCFRRFIPRSSHRLRSRLRGPVRRAGQRLAAGFGHGAKKLFKVPVAVDTPHGEGDDNEQEADLIRQHLRFIDL